jgi:hypothetical protein
MTHSPEKEHPQCNEKCECSAISSNEVIGDSEKAINNNHLTVGKEHHSEFVDLFFVAFIFILFEQVAAVILDKLSLLSNMAVRDTVQAILFLFVAIVLNVKYPLDIRQSDRRLLSNFTLIGIGFCIFRYMPYFNSLMNNHKINDIYASYLALHGLQYWWSIALLIPNTQNLWFEVV